MCLNKQLFKLIFKLIIISLPFNLSAITVEEVQAITADDGAANDAFGWSVAVDGDTTIIGANKDDSTNGGVYIFTRDANGNWNQQAKLQEANPGSEYGFSVAIDGDIAVVGAYLNNGLDGEAYVHTRSGSIWSSGIALSSLTSNSCQFCNQFGRSVAVSGTTVVVGSIFDNGSSNGADAGATYVFIPNGASWQPDSGTPTSINGKPTITTGMLIASVPGSFLPEADGNPNDHFGSAVAIDDNTLVVGAQNFNGTGAAYVFTRSAGNWSPVQRLNSGLGADTIAEFGSSIDLQNNRIIVGAHRENSPPLTNAEGAAYIFERTAFGQTFGSPVKFTPSATANSQVGSSVAIFGDNALVGAAGQSVAYLYSYNGSSWDAPQTLSKSFSSIFGQSVAIDADTFMVGDSGALAGQGNVAFYAEVDTTPDAFIFNPVIDAAADDFVLSNTVTITGIDSNAAISVLSGDMSINGENFSNNATTIANNDSVQLRGLSASNSLTTQSVILTIGNVTRQFDITTGDVISPEISAPPNITVATSSSSVLIDLFVNGAPDASDDVDANPVISHDQIADTVSFDAPGEYSVIWTATDSAGNSSNASQTVTLTSRALEADLSVALSADVNAAVEGDNITYTIAITNNGVDSASNVSAVFSLPGNTSLVSNSAECSENAGIVTCSQANLNNSAQASFNIVVQTTQAETLNASVNVSADEVDANAGNNSANNSITVESAVANLVTELSRTGATIIDVNETVTSTLKITNNGNAVAGNVSVNVRIESYSNPDLQFTDIDLAQCSADGQQNLGSRVFDVYNCDLGDINPAQSVELIISATAPAESSEFIAIMSISATSLGSMEENISIRSSGTVEVDEGGGGSGSINSLLLFLLALPIIISRRSKATPLR